MTQTLGKGQVIEGRASPRELYGLLEQIRRTLNQTYEANATVTTAGTGVATVAWTSPTMPADGVWNVRADIEGFATAGGTGAAAYLIVVGIESDAGVLTAIGGSSVTVMQRESDAAFDAFFSISGQTLLVKVQDNGVLTMKWKVHISLIEQVKNG